jgi:hypothetical protein
MTNLDFKAAIEEMKEAAKYLRAQGAKKVGVGGLPAGAFWVGLGMAGLAGACPAGGQPS